MQSNDAYHLFIVVFMSTEGRLVIRHLVLHNFKSYAGEQYIGPFHKVLSATATTKVLNATVGRV